MQLCRKMRDTEIAIFWDGNITKDIELFKSLGLIKIIDNGEYKAKDVYIEEELKEKLEIKDCGYARSCYKWQNVQLFNWIIFSDIYIFNGAIEDTEKAKAKVVSHQSYIENYRMKKVDLTKPLDLFHKLEESELN